MVNLNLHVKMYVKGKRYNLSIGMIILIIVSILIYFGLAQRALDRLRMNDRTALLFLIAIIVGGFLPDIPLGGNVAFNIGGGLIPVILVIYLFTKAQQHEIRRVIMAIIAATAVVFVFMRVMPAEPTYNFFLDPLYVTAIIAGVSGYISGRSRRGAFIAGTLAVVFNDLISQWEMAAAGATPSIVIGGAGAFDAVVLAGIIALGLAEVIGETAERIHLSNTNKVNEEHEPTDNSDVDNHHHDEGPASEIEGEKTPEE